MSVPWANIPQMVFSQAGRYKTKTVLRVKRGVRYQDISWSEFATQIEEIALGLIDLGLQPGERVAILSENRPEWAAADCGILASGAITVPIYTSLTSSEIEYLLKNSEAKFLFVASPDLAAKVFHFKETLDLKMILFDAPYRVSGPKVWWLGELLGLGRTAGFETKASLRRRLESTKPEDPASIIYTSGTTGSPKGVVLTHQNFLTNCVSVSKAIPVSEKDTLLSFLPLSHVFERMAGYYFVLTVGGTIAYAQNMDKVPENILEVRPTVITGVPRFYEKFKERIDEAVSHSSGIKRGLFRWAMAVGRRRADYKLNGKAVPLPVALVHWIADRLVFSKLRDRLGGRLRFCVSGGAPLAKSLAEFFYSVGILLVEGYGLTETSPVITVNSPESFRFGTVGQPLKDVEIRIAEDGEILTRGPHVMKGYFRLPAATGEAINAEGWFHTGDVGVIDSEGFLTITDRKKDLIKTSGGKLVAPQNIEAQLKADPWIADCMIVGDKRKYLTALIVPQIGKLEEYAAKHKIFYEGPEDLLKRPAVTEWIWKRVERINGQLASFEQIKRVTLLAQPFTTGSGELTPTLKVKRQVVNEKFSTQIEAMYGE